MQDPQLIDLYWQRDQQAITATADTYGPYCYAIADRILHDHQANEECCNDTWLAAWRAMPPQRPTRLRLWLGKVTRNLAFDRYRADHALHRGGGQMPLVLEELSHCLSTGTGNSPSPEEALEAQELAASLRRFLAQLPERQRSLFLRRYFYAEPVQDIAARFRLTPANVSQNLRRTRLRLQTHLQKEGFL